MEGMNIIWNPTCSASIASDRRTGGGWGPLLPLSLRDLGREEAGDLEAWPSVCLALLHTARRGGGLDVGERWGPADGEPETSLNGSWEETDESIWHHPVVFLHPSVLSGCRSAGLSNAQSKARNVKRAKVFLQEKKNEERNYNFWVLQKLEICFWYNDIVGLIFDLTYNTIIRSLAIIHVWEHLWAVNLTHTPKHMEKSKTWWQHGQAVSQQLCVGCSQLFCKNITAPHGD